MQKKKKKGKKKKYVTFDGRAANCQTNGNECLIYQSQDVSKVIRNSIGKYQVFWTTPFIDSNYAIFMNSNINSGNYGFAQIGGNNDPSAICANNPSSKTCNGINEYYVNVDAIKLGTASNINADSDYISVVATIDFFDVKLILICKYNTTYKKR